jgi:murein DD-endopeptidase MepM/ murein hydrolase activator NlpD
LTDRGKDPVVEVQIHPGSLRWGVRYFFLSRRQVILWSSLVCLACAFVLVNVAMFPGVVGGLFRHREYQALMNERNLQGERIQSMNAELALLADQVGPLRERTERILLTYGLTADESIGEGGYPFEDATEIESIWSGAVSRGLRLENRVAQELAVIGSFVAEVESFEAAHEDQIRTTPSVSPINLDDSVLTSPFGTRKSPFTKQVGLHAGLDLAAKIGTPIHAPADGVVVFAGRYPVRQSVGWWRYGNLVAIRHGERFITLFGHCEEISVRQGQKVSQRELIATVGNTGWSTSPHLHYEVRRLEEDGNFVPVDPRVYILDQTWRDQEQLLVRGRRAPDLSGYEPLPRPMKRQ